MIVVFGSINVDFVTRTDHIPVPGETVRGDNATLIPGGKGANQALAAVKAGAPTVMAGAVGHDHLAEIALAELRKYGVNLDAVAASSRPTGTAFITVDARGENAIVVASGANLDASVSTLPPLHQGDILLLQREIPDEQNLLACRKARAQGTRVALNAAPCEGFDPSWIEEVDILIVNEIELEAAAAGLPTRSTSFAFPSPLPDPVPTSTQEALFRLLSHAPGLTVVVTLGPLGALWASSSALYYAPAPKIVPIDTTAAGDTFVGALSAALDAGLPPEQALRRGVTAGSLTCQNFGAQSSIPDKVAINEALSQIPTLSGQ